MAAWFIVSHRMGAKSCRRCVTATSTIGDCDVRSSVLQDVKGENNERFVNTIGHGNFTQNLLNKSFSISCKTVFRVDMLIHFDTHRNFYFSTLCGCTTVELVFKDLGTDIMLSFIERCPDYTEVKLNGNDQFGDLIERWPPGRGVHYLLNRLPLTVRQGISFFFFNSFF